MVIEYPLWRVKSYEHGYEVDRRVNENRWKAEGYYSNLQQACLGLLDQRVRTETTEHIINTLDRAAAQVSTARLVKKLDDITKELLEGINQ